MSLFLRDKNTIFYIFRTRAIVEQACAALGFKVSAWYFPSSVTVIDRLWDTIVPEAEVFYNFH